MSESTPSELERSYELIGRILATLVAVGLRQVDLEVEDFGSDEEGDDADEHFRAVMQFLTSEGFVRSSSQLIEGGWLEVQLTSRGLAAIEDRRFDDGGTVRTEIETKKGELSAGAFTKIGAFVGGLMGGAAKTLGG